MGVDGDRRAARPNRLRGWLPTPMYNISTDPSPVSRIDLSRDLEYQRGRSIDRARVSSAACVHARGRVYRGGILAGRSAMLAPLHSIAFLLPPSLLLCLHRVPSIDLVVAFSSVPISKQMGDTASFGIRSRHSPFVTRPLLVCEDLQTSSPSTGESQVVLATWRGCLS